MGSAGFRHATIAAAVIVIWCCAGAAQPRSADAQEIRTSGEAPAADASACALSWQAQDGRLVWRYFNQGDYNQDGYVTVNDLTPLGQHFGESGPFAPESAVSCIDGNGDGLITVNDITPIGVNFGNLVKDYNIYYSTSPADYPSGASAGNGGATFVDSVAFSAGEQPAGQRKVFSYSLTLPAADGYYWVRPADGADEGTPSNYVQVSSGGQWYLEVVDGQGDVGRYASLALAPDGRPHISYFDYSKEDLKYAFHDGAGWVTSTLDETGSVGWFTSIALDGTGAPRICYFDDTADAVMLAYLLPAGWTMQVVDADIVVNNTTSLALDSADLPHVSYFDTTSYELKYARHDATKWIVETVCSVNYQSGWTNKLALSGAGTPHISYFGNGGLHYATYDGDSWQLLILSPFDSGLYNSIALDGAGRPHVAFFNSWNWDLRYSYYDGEDWRYRTIDSAGSVGMYPSLAVDAGGRVHFGYYDSQNKDLKYATYDPQLAQAETGVIDAAGDVGAFVSLALDSAGRPHIAYYDNTNEVLKYATYVD